MGGGKDMKDEERSKVIADTLVHIRSVSVRLSHVCSALLERAAMHDISKLEDPEITTFIEYISKLEETTYGSDGYKQCLMDMKPALDHHYENNRHHPEYFQEEVDATYRSSPVNCMTLIDIVEMLCDWDAAASRHNDGDIMRSIDINKDRFGLSDQLVSIMKNTVKMWSTSK